MPEIEIEGPTAWTINGTPRQHGDPACQLIMTIANACETCPLAVYPSDDPPSEFLKYLVHLEGLQAVGAHFAFEELPMIDWQGLKVLASKRNEKQIKKMKDDAKKK